VTFARVRGLLIAYGYSFPVATALAVLMTEAERQPVEVEGNVFHVPVGQRHCVQGAPTSPGICNAILLRLDRRLSAFAKKHGLNYTRYADDLSFSGEIDRKAAGKFRAIVSRIISEEGFTANSEKTRLMGQGNRQTVTGVVVNKTLGLSRQERRLLRAMMHRLSRQPTNDESGKLGAKIEGKLAYLSMLNPEQAARFNRAEQ
jgi:RNA-directed DNA polymerase